MNTWTSLVSWVWLDPYLGSHKVDIRPAWGVRFGYLCTWLLSSNGLGYHGETGSPWYGQIAELVRAFGICPEGPGFNPWSGHFYKFNTWSVLQRVLDSFKDPGRCDLGLRNNVGVSLNFHHGKLHWQSGEDLRRGFPWECSRWSIHQDCQWGFWRSNVPFDLQVEEDRQGLWRRCTKW